MHSVDAVARAIDPWSRRLARASASPALTADAAGRTQLDDAQSVLQTLARREIAIPAELPAEATAAIASWPRTEGRPRGFNQMRRRRAAVLRLGVWDCLAALRAALPPRERAPLAALQAWLAQRSLAVPPGLGPSLPYAGSEAARVFFDRQLRAALARLGERHDDHGARFGALAAAPAFESTVVGVHHWSGAWSCAVAAVYLDWLAHAAQDDLDAAQRLLWREQNVRFRAPEGLVVLPTRERAMHLDLWSDLVLAQVLQHDPTRWPAAADPWFRVRLAMHDLGERARGARDPADRRTLFRGLSIEMLYQAVFIGRAQAALDADTSVAPPNPAAGAPGQWVVDLPLPSPGQQANFELVVRWRDSAATPGPTRFAGAQPAVPANLDDAQRAWLVRWRETQAASPERASHVDATALDWRVAAADDSFTDDEGQCWAALGHGALWRCAGDEADWLDTVLLAYHAGAWSSVPLHLQDDGVDGVPRTWLFVRQSADVDVPALRAAFASAHRACWAIRRAGLGAFVMAAADLAQPPLRDAP